MNDPFLPEELRLFVACEVPESWTRGLAHVNRELSKAGLGDLRWVRPEGIHLTLKFLGEVGRHLLPDLQDAIAAACAGAQPFDLQLSELGSFGGRGRVRVLWAGIAGDLEALRGLHGRVDTEMSGLSFPRETRPYSPHLTLARAPENAAADTGERVASALRLVKLPQTETLTVRRLSLMRSQLGSGGATYTRLDTASIGPAAGEV